MIDIETMGTAHDAAVIAIGAIVFDPKKTTPIQGMAHKAADDARHQAAYVNRIIASLK